MFKLLVHNIWKFILKITYWIQTERYFSRRLRITISTHGFSPLSCFDTCRSYIINSTVTESPNWGWLVSRHQMPILTKVYTYIHSITKCTFWILWNFIYINIYVYVYIIFTQSRLTEVLVVWKHQDSLGKIWWNLFHNHYNDTHKDLSLPLIWNVASKYEISVIFTP